MGTIIGTYLWLICIVLLALVCVAALYFGVRLRRQARRDDSFECGYRRDITAGWTSGVACYGQSKLLWYRVVSLKWGPDLAWDRSSLKIRSAHVRGAVPVTVGKSQTSTSSGSSGSQIMEVHCESRQLRFILAMHQQDYHALVSWLEGAPPQSDILL